MIYIQQCTLSAFCKNAFVFLECSVEIFRSIGDIFIELPVEFLIFIDNRIHIKFLRLIQLAEQFIACFNVAFQFFT